ncbi:MAG: hypothetical protein O3C34_04450 [Proteobacteria bacterium]|nr:hypothetical protein [Pseudomonadota bacterium]
MSRFKFDLDAISSRKFGLYQIAITVTRKDLKNFIAALKKLRAKPQEPIVITQDRFPKSFTLRRSLEPRKKREWSIIEETANGYKAKLFDTELEGVMEYYVDWLNHGLPAYSGEKVSVKLRGEEIDLFFTQDASSDRTETNSS